MCHWSALCQQLPLPGGLKNEAMNRASHCGSRRVERSTAPAPSVQPTHRAGANVVNAAHHGGVRLDQRRGAHQLHVVAHALLQVAAAQHSTTQRGTARGWANPALEMSAELPVRSQSTLLRHMHQEAARLCTHMQRIPPAPSPAPTPTPHPPH